MKGLRSHLAGKLLIVFVALVMIAAGTVASVSYETTRSALEREVSLRLSGLAEQKAYQLEAWSESVRSTLEVAASLPEISTSLAQLNQEARRTGPSSRPFELLSRAAEIPLRNYAAQFGYSDLILISPEEKVLLCLSQSHRPGSDLRSPTLRDTPLARSVQQARMLMAPEISDFTSTQPDQEPITYLAAPVRGQGRLVGVLVAQLDNRSLTHIVNEVTTLGESGEVLLGTLKGERARLLTPTRFDREAARVGWLPIQRSTMRGLGVALVNPWGLTMTIDHRGHTVLAAWRYSPALAASVVAKLDLDEAYQPVEAQRRNFLLVLAAAFLCAVGVGLLIARSITRPLVHLTRAVGAMAKGDLAQTVAVKGEDELARLAEGFNAMAAELATLYTNIEQKVEQRTQQLQRQTEMVEMLRRVATQANQAQSIQEVLQTGLDAVAGYAGWPLGQAILWDEQQGRLQPGEIWHCDRPQDFVRFMEVSRTLSIQPGEGLPGRVLVEARPVAMADISQNIPYSDSLEKEPEVRGAFAFPVWAGSQVVAVLQFFRPQAGLPEPELLDASLEVGLLLGRVFERERSQAELRVARDVAERANEAKTTFLASMSHEVRTPMNAVIGMTGLLMETELTHEQRDYARTVLTSGENLLAILNEILDFSKIEAGRLELESVPFDITGLVEGALDLMAGPAAQKGLDLAYVIGAGTPRILVGDATRLRQILVNLISNAIKFTEQGEVVVSLTGRSLGDSDLHEVAFRVRDTGIGIPPERMDRLFQPFSQVDASTSRRYGGTGLGLVISKRFAEAMGGSMGIESYPGQGSTVHFTVLGQALPGPVPQYEEAHQPHLLSKRLLVVDDNETNRHLVRLRCELWGMLCQDCGSPQQALEWISSGQTFEAAILDIQMPDMDGIALAQAIHELPGGREIPLIAWTSLGRREAEGQVHFAAHLHKPLRPSQLYNVLVELFGGQLVQVSPDASESQYDPTLGQRHPLRLLVADDVAVNVKMMNLMLSRFGYRCDSAGNGLEVLEAIGRQTYDVILMDVNMPEMDGLEATREIFRRLPPARRPRIVALTANVMSDDQQQFRQAGMEDFLSKPVSVADLKAVLLRCAGLSGTAAHDSPISPPQPFPLLEVPSEPALDPKMLASLRQTCQAGSPDALNELLALVEVEFPDLFQALGQARDSNRLTQAAHALKGGASSMGALKLGKLAQALEKKGQAGVPEASAEELSAIEQQIDLVLNELRHIVSQKKS